MSDDRELLEKAARAAGVNLTWGEKYRVGDDEVDCSDIPYAKGGSPDESPYHWCPLTDDGDALRLQALFGFTVSYYLETMEVCVSEAYVDEALASAPFFDEPTPAGRAAATRRAIVRAAAALDQGRDGRVG